MFPESAKIIGLSNTIINNWHENEVQIASFDDAFNLIKNKDQNDIYYHIELLSLINTCLWHEEDKARDTDASDNEIASVKRKIDKFNSMRVNKIEEIDQILFENISRNSDLPLNTESAGSVIDRLTIFVLKKIHMEIETNRKDSEIELRKNCAEKLEMINRQIKDLASAYDFLIEEIKTGKRRYALYKQFKMYNDPELNPVLYKKK
jgi:hypothetical protein